MKSKNSTGILILVFLLGFSLLSYPTVADRWNARTQSRAIASYTDTVAKLDPDRYNEIWQTAEEYNRAVAVNPDRYLPTPEEHQQYLEALDVSGNGIMGYIEIPRIKVSIPIYHGTDASVLQVAVGHIEGTSLPTGGEGNHIALSGHRGLPSAKLFTDLDQLEEGDIFLLSVLDRTLTYEVDQIRIVTPDDLSPLEIEEGRDDCTLVTCTPYGINSHRLLLRGRRIENLKEAMVAPADAFQVDTLLVAPVVAVPLLLVLLLWLMLPRRRNREE